MRRLTLLAVLALAFSGLAWSAAAAPSAPVGTSYRDCGSSTGHGPATAAVTVYAKPDQVTCLRRAFLSGCKPAELVAGTMGVDVSSSYRLRVQAATMSLGPCHSDAKLVRYFSPVKLKRDQSTHSCQAIKATKTGLLFKRCGPIGDIALLPSR
jgi:hypothetical protein